jgi:hypothetical protein
VKKLVKFNCDWADEFDVYGFTIIENDEWDKFMQAIENLDYPHESYFGTNEAIIFERRDDIIRSFKVVDITDQEADIFKRCFQRYPDDEHINFGYIPFTSIIESIPEEAYIRIYGPIE